MSETTNLKLFKQDNPTTNTNNFDIEKTLNENWDKLDENAGTTNKKLESLEKVDSTTNETITAIQEEQTTQNENIEKNAEGIAQNKKDVDEELTKIKKENSLLKSQIPEGHASGNNIHLEDSSNMDFEWTLRGGSWQATRSGKNVFDNTVEPQFISNAKKEIINTGERIILTAKTFSYAIFKVEKNIREYAGKTVRLKMDFSKSNANLNPKYGVLLGSSDYSNREVKGESTVSGYTITFNLPSELENEKEYLFVRLYATQNNEGNIENYVDYTNIILTIDNENMSYEAFGVSPSPKFPSEIKNVGDNINVFNKTADDFKNGETIGWAKKVILTLEPNTYYTCSTNDVVIPGGSTSNLLFGDTDSKKYTVIKGYPISYKTDESGHVPIFLRQTNIDVFFANYYIKVEKGLRATSFSAYNCGNVGVTISNRNLFNPEWLVIGNLSADGQEFFQNNCARTKHISVEPNENLSITMFDTTNFRASALCFYDKDKNLIKRTVAPSNVGWDNFSTMGNCKYIRFTIAVLGSKYSTFTEEALQEASNNLQLERGVSTSYIPHKEQEIVFPLTEGQKLYEGSYLAEDGIHNIRRQDILTGEESLQNYHSDTSNGFVGFEFTMSNKHKKNADFLCTHLTKNSDNVYYNRGLGGWLPDEDKWCYICVPISILKDVSTAEKQIESMKEYLTEQYNAGTPMKFEYELATEEIIPYTTEQQAVIDKILYTYKNVTNISVDDELATLDITYKKDIETMFNNQAKEYNERLSNIESLLNTTSTSALLLDNLENDLKEEV